MIQVTRDQALAEQDIPFGLVEVHYPAREQWREADFWALAEEELAALSRRFPDYDRKEVFGENPYYRFFKKFKKTYPVMLQMESVLFKGRPFPRENPVTGVAL